MVHCQSSSDVTVAKFPEGKPSNVSSTLHQQGRADIGGCVPSPRLRPFWHSQECSLVRTVSCQIREVGPSGMCVTCRHDPCVIREARNGDGNEVRLRCRKWIRHGSGWRPNQNFCRQCVWTGGLYLADFTKGTIQWTQADYDAADLTTNTSKGLNKAWQPDNKVDLMYYAGGSGGPFMPGQFNHAPRSSATAVLHKTGAAAVNLVANSTHCCCREDLSDRR